MVPRQLHAHMWKNEAETFTTHAKINLNGSKSYLSIRTKL